MTTIAQNISNYRTRAFCGRYNFARKNTAMRNEYDFSGAKIRTQHKNRGGYPSMGDLLFFVYTSTPHRHLQNNFKNEKKTMGIFMSFSVNFRYLFM